MTDFARAIKLPFTDYQKLGIASGVGVLASIPLLGLLATILLYGYGGAIATSKKAQLPAWDTWSAHFSRGAIMFAIGLLYALPVIIIAIALVAMGIVAYFVGSSLPASIPASLLGLIIVAVLLGLAISYIAPMAILRYLYTKKFSAAFDFQAVLAKAMRGNYFLAWLFIIAYSVLLSVITAALSSALAFTIVGPMVVSGFLSALIGITAFDLYGQVYREN